MCLRVLAAWEEWLEVGGLCDIYGVSSLAARYFRDDSVKLIRQKFPTHHVLVDETQDTSSLELRILRKLITSPEKRPNAFFFAGDANQKIYVKHHNMASVDLPMQGRASRLQRNYRNTKQILRAAWCVAEAFPPQVETDDAVELIPPELSIYEGGMPVVYRCPAASQEDLLLQLLHLRRDSRVAVVSEDDRLLHALKDKLRSLNVSFIELLRNDDLDRWGQLNVASLSAKLVVGRLDAVKGYEFDTVIIGNFSSAVVPSASLPTQEYWREAATVYSALTRARDELVITYAGSPSLFLTKMEACVQAVETPHTNDMEQMIGPVGVEQGSFG